MAGQFSELLRQLRLQKRLTQEELADGANLSVRTVRRLETGERTNPQLDTVRFLGDALNLGPHQRAQLLAAAGVRVTSDAPRHDAKRPESAFERSLAEATDDLAYAVRARWGREEELQRIQDPCPLPVRWELAPAGVMDHWENICRVSPGGSAKPLELAGRLAEIADIYRLIPSGRLVVLGRTGSGKSVLAVRFVLDVLRMRERGDPVPVVFSPASWDPTTTGFRDWLADQLVRDHPGLAATGPSGSSLATALVEAGRILPVLDGFDELAAGLHRAALDALNATTLPMLVTSRPGEYASVAGTDALTAAAAVRLTDLTVTDLVNYLPRTTRKDAGTTVWEPVLKELRDHPERPASVNLRAVLTTPLMVMLARAIYSDAAGPDPSVLLDTDRFGSQYELEGHLLSSFIPTVYRDDPRWDHEQVRRWFGHLAQHLDRLGTQDLAWWQLGNGMRRASRMLVVGLVSGLAVGLLSGLLVWFVAGGSGLAVLGNWLGIGLALGLGQGAALSLGGGAFEPTRLRLRTRGGAQQLRTRFGRRLLAGLVGGVGLGPALGLVGFGFIGGLATGAGLGMLAGCGWGLMAGLEAPVDVRSAAGPADLLRTNRTTVVAELLGWGLALGLIHLVVATLVPGYLRPAGLPLALVFGLMIGTSVTAWGQWLVFARLWLPLTGRLPWSVVAFLDDACRRGVLRQVGAVYQFRHVRLQSHLAAAS